MPDRTIVTSRARKLLIGNAVYSSILIKVNMSSPDGNSVRPSMLARSVKTAFHLFCVRQLRLFGVVVFWCMKLGHRCVCCMFVCLFVFLPVCLSLLFSLSLSLSVNLFICLSVCYSLSPSLSICQSTCLSVCLC